MKQLYFKHFGRAVVYTLLSLFLCMAGAGKGGSRRIRLQASGESYQHKLHKQWHRSNAQIMDVQPCRWLVTLQW